MNTEETIWTKDFNVLFEKEKLFKYIPLNSYSNYEKINSMMRFTLYISVLLSFLYKNLNYFFIFIICGVVTFIMYNNEEKKDDKILLENLENYNKIKNDPDIKKHKINHKKYLKKCVLPSRNNPFMNVLPTDNRKRKEACKSYNDEKIKNLVDDKFSKGLYKDINSVYNNENSQREFYTMPNTTIPNKQGDFANWLYGIPKTCKEGNGNQCVGNNLEKLNGESYKFY
jgi:hypothetical protein